MTRASAVPSPLGTLAALLVAETRAFFRNARSLLWTVALPLLVLFLGEGRVHKGLPIAPVTFTIAATALMLGIFTLGLFGYATVLATYRERGVFQRLRCSPVPAWQLLGARILVQLLAVLLQAVLLFAVAWATYGVVPSATGIGLGLVVTVLAGLTALALGQVVVAFVGSAGGVAAVSRVLLIALLLLQGLFFGSKNWPGWLRQFGNWTPIRIATLLLRDGLVLQHWTSTDLGYVAGLVAWIVVLAYLGISRFRWKVV
jgi:ABC-2 type transport system permease protein